MYISAIDLIKQRLCVEGKLNQSEIIKSILNDAGIDAKRKFYDVGERYYQGEHDILKHNFQKTIVYDTQEDDDGTFKDYETTVINKNISNMHNVHLFHKELVDQKIGYVVGKQPTLSTDDPALSSILSEISKDESFPDALADWLKGAANKGIEWTHFYYDIDGTLKYCVISAKEIIAFWDSDHQQVLEELIRYYTYEVVINGKTAERYKVEWWTKNDVTYYIQNEYGNYSLDPSYPLNPMPHWWSITTLDGAEINRVAHSWGRVPFVPLHNNSDDISDLGGQDGDGRPKGIKSLIDAYDMISSRSTNDQIDLVSLYWIIQGFGGEVASQVIKKLQVNKVVNVEGSNDGKVTAQQVVLNVEERIKWLDMLRHDIYHFGMGIDTSDEQLGNNPSGVALKFKYSQLDLKANPLILKLKKALKEFLGFLIDDYNRSHGTSFDTKQISITINKSLITNDSDLVDEISKSRGLVPDKMLLEAHPLVTDAGKAYTQLQAQQVAEDKRRSDQFGYDDIPMEDDDKEGGQG